MLYLVAYDIEEDKIRDKIAQKLIRFGFERIQYSVFVGKLNQSQKDKLTLVIQKLIEPSESKSFKYMIMPLAESYVYKTQWLGKDPPEWDYHYGTLNTLIL